MYDLLPKTSRNFNVACKPLVVRLYAARFRKLYLLWNSLPSDIGLLARVHVDVEFMYLVLTLC
jgi:hypothetical protein